MVRDVDDEVRTSELAAETLRDAVPRYRNPAERHSQQRFAIIATDAKSVIQLFDIGAGRMLGYAASDVVNGHFYESIQRIGIDVGGESVQASTPEPSHSVSGNLARPEPGVARLPRLAIV